ncbi:MAG: class I SAM-dependent methyltransferase [Oscillochloridaceae bacterium umkhey_bin13]
MALDQPHTALLRACLEQFRPPDARVALDLACGAGHKTAWLRACCPPEALVVGLDHASAALAAARFANPTGPWVRADAQALPLRDASLDLIWCVAALHLLDDPQQGLGEALRVLRPGGSLLLVTATTRWVRLRPPPAHPTDPLPALADDLGHDLAGMLTAVGFPPPRLHALLLDPPGLSLTAAAAPLLDWPDLEPAEPEPQPILLVAHGAKPCR